MDILTWGWPPLSPHLHTAPVTLDEASAHPDLILSQDLKIVTLDLASQGSSKKPGDHRRFYRFPCVLGSLGLNYGRSAWGAGLQGPGGGACVLDVALKLVPRRGFLEVEPLTGFRALHITGSEYPALTESGSWEDVPVCPNKVGVHVDYEGGEVVF